jgi:hypothetical protein
MHRRLNRNSSEFERSLPVFDDVLASYFFVLYIFY